MFTRTFPSSASSAPYSPQSSTVNQLKSRLRSLTRVEALFTLSPDYINLAKKWVDAQHMTSGDIQLLYEYDRWANRRVLKAASTLSLEQFTRDMSGSFRSVREILLHILGGEWIWLAYWKNPPTGSASLSELRTQRDALFSANAFANVDAVESKWTEI